MAFQNRLIFFYPSYTFQVVWCSVSRHGTLSPQHCRALGRFILRLMQDYLILHCSRASPSPKMPTSCPPARPWLLSTPAQHPVPAKLGFGQLQDLHRTTHIEASQF